MIAHIKQTIQLPLALRVALLYVAVIAAGVTSYLQTPTEIYEPAAALQPAPVQQVTLTETTKPEKILTGKPVNIRAPSVDINLDVIEGFYDKETDDWTLTDDNAQFAVMTSQPNDSTGNTFIYGHNTSAVFAPLIYMSEGDEVMVTTSNKLTFTYRYTGVKIVDPTTTSILLPTEEPRLTLMMCEGVFDQHRRVMIFDLVEVKS